MSEPILRPYQLPPADFVRSDDVIMLDSQVAGTRRIGAANLGRQVLVDSGDTLYYRVSTLDPILAAQSNRIGNAERSAITAIATAGLAQSQAASAEDSATAAMDLAQAAVASAAGFPVSGFLGQLTALDQNPGAAVSNLGKWWQVGIEGTLSHALTTGMNVHVGDRLLCDGVVWQLWVLPPTFLTQGSVLRHHLEKVIRDILSPLESDEFALVVLDSAQRRAFAIGRDGTITGNFVLKDESVTTATMADESVTRTKLETALQEVLALPLLSSDYAYVILDSEDRIGLGIRNDGTIEGKFAHTAGSVTTSALADGAVTRVKLDSVIAEAIPESVPDIMEFSFSVVDSEDRVAFGVRKDGSVFARIRADDGTLSGLTIAPGTIPVSRFDADTKRATLSGPGDIITDEPDALRRGAKVDITALTDASVGTLPLPFPPLRTPVLYGVNGTGTTLEFSRAPEFVVRGIYDRGTWAASSTPPASTAARGDWWTVSSGGTLLGVTYVTGDRIHCLGSTKQSSTVTPQFAKAKPGEFWHKGEFDPSSFSPSSPADGDHWIASTSGTFGGFTFATGDQLFRVGSTWLHVPRDDFKTVANGAAWQFRVRNASEIQVRRADKSTTAVTVTASAYTTSNQRRTSDGIVFRGDSLVATNGLDVALRGLIAPRTLTSYSWAAGNSDHVVTSALKDMAGADSFRGWLHLWMFGTNDVGYIEPTIRAALLASRLSGAADGRCVFMTIPGQFAMTWNGTRLVHGAQEDLTAGTNVYWDLEQFYAKAFPGRHIRTLNALIQRAPSIPSMHHPGMTEVQACATYGIAPSSFFFDYESKLFTAADLNFVAYRSAAGLPTGGTDGDYYLRTGNGSIGVPIIRWGGTWVEYAMDVTHLSPAGNRALAAEISDFLTTNML